jgi:hypothetical protein
MRLEISKKDKNVRRIKNHIDKESYAISYDIKI